MRIAALCDIHGNLPALDAVLAELELIGPDAIVIGGDVAPGPLQSQTVERLRGLGERARFVMGNGDREVVAAFDAGLRPEDADDEFARRLQKAATVRADFASTEGLGESDFERTERIPVERVQAPGEYVRDTDEWIARCVARVLELDPIIKREEAHRSVSELAELERWRLMKPEAAADQLYTPIKPR